MIDLKSKIIKNYTPLYLNNSLFTELLKLMSEGYKKKSVERFVSQVTGWHIKKNFLDLDTSKNVSKWLAVDIINAEISRFENYLYDIKYSKKPTSKREIKKDKEDNNNKIIKSIKNNKTNSNSQKINNEQNKNNRDYYKKVKADVKNTEYEDKIKFINDYFNIPQRLLNYDNDFKINPNRIKIDLSEKCTSSEMYFTIKNAKNTKIDLKDVNKLKEISLKASEIWFQEKIKDKFIPLDKILRESNVILFKKFGNIKPYERFNFIIMLNIDKENDIIEAINLTHIPFRFRKWMFKFIYRNLNNKIKKKKVFIEEDDLMKFINFYKLEPFIHRFDISSLKPGFYWRINLMKEWKILISLNMKVLTYGISPDTLFHRFKNIEYRPYRGKVLKEISKEGI